MRKFRAFDPQTNHMYFSPNQHIYMNIDGTCINFQNSEILEVMFEIGEEDKNKKLIYEGDICKVVNPNGDEDDICIVEYENSCYPYAPDDGYGEFDISSIGWAMDMEFSFEVIGNIQQHKIEDFQ